MPSDSHPSGRHRAILHGRTNLYGYAVGILMIEGYFPRPPGAIGNAATFPFPVLHHVVKGATGVATVRSLSTLLAGSQSYRDAIAPWIAGAQALERDGVRAITTSCGFSAIFQCDLAEAVNVPVFASSLMLAPLISRMLKPGRLVGVISADARSLTGRHFAGAGVDPAAIAVAGLEGCEHFEETTYRDHHDLDLRRLQAEVLSAVDGLLRREPRVGALLLECSLLPPYTAPIREKTGLPVFDCTHLITLVHNAVAGGGFNGFP